MINSLRDTHKGSTISVVASGPSAVLYDGQGDVSIGVNGAAMLGPVFDYFLCGDAKSSECDWFHINCSKARVIARLIASKDYQLYPEHIYKYRLRSMPPPVSPHKTFKYGYYNREKLALDKPRLLYGGTISCCAIQLAKLMGASRIVLFGCNFSHNSGQYFYKANKIGSVSRSQTYVMQDVINVLRTGGIQIDIVGESLLL
jgi:hypothetical protein